MEDSIVVGQSMPAIIVEEMGIISAEEVDFAEALAYQSDSNLSNNC